MNDDTYKKGIEMVMKLLLTFQASQDDAAKRVLRDTIRAMVKELTKV